MRILRAILQAAKDLGCMLISIEMFSQGRRL